MRCYRIKSDGPSKTRHLIIFLFTTDIQSQGEFTEICIVIFFTVPYGHRSLVSKGSQVSIFQSTEDKTESTEINRGITQ